ncbi:MAG: MgtC/SapB family protein [Alphaproteobacteria bacterium]|nr:MgtC/SapB family protein [Alphaproteobacteria bacterium]
MTWEQITLRLGIALLLGGMIGLERQWRSHYVGLRTNTLITIGSAALMIFGLMLPAGDPAGLGRIASQIITGVGFLCAGVIMHEGVNIKGFNTAATLWCSVAVGMFAGTGLFIPAGILTIFIILVNLLMLPAVYFINRTTTPEEMESNGHKPRSLRGAKKDS